MKASAFGLASVALLLSVAAGPARTVAQPANPNPIPTVTPYVLPSAVPPAVSPIPIPSTQLPRVPAVEPGYNASAGPLPTPGIAGVAQEPYVGISLDDAVTMALMRNPNLAVSQANRRIAAYQVIAAEGAYDVRFQLVPSYTHSVQPPSSFFAAGPSAGPITADTLGMTGGFSGQTLGGTRLSISGTGSRLNSNAVANSYNPSYPSALSFNVTQPLARGLRMDDSRRALDIARITESSDTDALLVNAQQTVANVANTYWSLVAAWRNVAIQEEGLRSAVAQAQSTQRQAKAGAVAPVDVAESNDQVAQFQDNVYSALQSVQELQSQLKSLILGDPSDPVWTANLVPTTSVTQTPAEPTVNDVLVAALGNRPEIAQLRDQQRAAQVNVAYAKDQLKPQLDLGVGYTSNGFAGNAINPMASPVTGLFLAEANAIDQLIAIANQSLPPGQKLTPLPPLHFGGPSYINGNFGTSVNNLFNNDFPTYTAQLTIGLPLRNRAARGNYDAAVEQSRSLQAQQVGLIQRLRMESANAVQMLRSAQSRLIAARTARQSAEEVYASELRKYRAGTSTTFLVLQRVINLANDRGRELQAQTDVNKALVNIQLVEGKLLSGYNIDTGAIGTQTLMRTGSTAPKP